MQAGYHISQNGGKYFFFIRNYGKYFFRLSDREGYFSHTMGQKAASICSESGNFLLLFAIRVGDFIDLGSPLQFLDDLLTRARLLQPCGLARDRVVCLSQG